MTKREYVRLATELFGNLGLQADADECECVSAVLCAACEDCIGYIALTLDRVSRERTRQALERAQKAIRDACSMCDGSGSVGILRTGYGLDAEGNCVPVPIQDAEGCEYCGRPIAAIRELSDGESVASEEK